MIQPVTEDFFQTDDGERLFYRYVPSPQAGHLLMILHGFGEHSGRYQDFCAWMKCREPRLSFLSYDLRGHGQSSGSRASIKNFSDYGRDTRSLLMDLQRSLGVPRRTILLGHSMGGLIALQGLTSGGFPEADGVILSSPCLGLPLNSILKRVVMGIGTVMPQYYFKNPVIAENLTHDLSEIRKYLGDPLISKKISARLLLQMILAGQELERAVAQLRIPAFFLLAGDERVVDLKKSLSFYARLEAPVKRLRCFEGFRHEIFNEVQRQIAYDTVLDSVQKILAPGR